MTSLNFIKNFVLVFCLIFGSCIENDSSRGISSSSYEKTDCLKIYTTLYKPVRKEELASTCKEDIRKKLKSKNQYVIKLDRFTFDDTKRFYIQKHIAYMNEYPEITKQYYDHWITYQLLNTILFSPAIELGTTEKTDVERVYNLIYNGVSRDLSIRTIVLDYTTSESYWRRFRSPEDNTRETMEIFIENFNDSDVPLASKACKNWHLNYKKKLVKDSNVNTDPIDLFGKTIYTCNDFFNAIKSHPNLIPRVTSIIVDHMLGDAPKESKEELVDYVLSKKPRTFRDIYDSILFSDIYLTEPRLKTPEELILGNAYLFSFKPPHYFYKQLDSKFRQAGYPVFTNKLGRDPSPKTDIYSFTLLQTTLRWMLTDPLWSDKDPSGIDFNMFPDTSFDDWLDTIFNDTIGRSPTKLERNKLRQLINRSVIGSTNVKTIRKSVIVMDYLSRLSELYHY